MWMLRLTIIALVTFTGLALANIARADPLDDAMRWVADNSRFEFSHQTPKIVPMSEEEWDKNGWQFYWAVYDKGFIYIPDWEQIPDSTWVHEVVHHYQWLNGEMPPGYCAGEHEPEAYALEAQWRNEHGYEQLELDRFALISAQAMCNSPHQ